MLQNDSTFWSPLFYQKAIKIYTERVTTQLQTPQISRPDGGAALLGAAAMAPIDIDGDAQAFDEASMDFLHHARTKVMFARLQSFSDWVLEMWCVSGREMSVNDLLVMACGLPGEAGEMLEKHAFMQTCKADRGGFVLEMGDVLFYWCRIARHFDLSIEEILGVSDDIRFLPAGAARLPISVGEVSEAIKKHVRNDNLRLTRNRRARIVEGLGVVWQDWRAVMQAHDLGLSEVITASQHKMHARLARRELR